MHPICSLIPAVLCFVVPSIVTSMILDYLILELGLQSATSSFFIHFPIILCNNCLVVMLISQLNSSRKSFIADSIEIPPLSSPLLTTIDSYEVNTTAEMDTTSHYDDVKELSHYDNQSSSDFLSFASNYSNRHHLTTNWSTCE